LSCLPKTLSSVWVVWIKLMVTKSRKKLGGEETGRSISLAEGVLARFSIISGRHWFDALRAYFPPIEYKDGFGGRHYLSRDFCGRNLLHRFGYSWAICSPTITSGMELKKGKFATGNYCFFGICKDTIEQCVLANTK
jgi:hypothetical protein